MGLFTSGRVVARQGPGEGYPSQVAHGAPHAVAIDQAGGSHGTAALQPACQHHTGSPSLKCELSLADAAHHIELQIP